ncbi:MAG: class I SAM-dependent methyltransferase [Chloroflexota bacterium]
MQPISIQAYNSETRANTYHKRTGFDPERKERMLDATLRILLELTPDSGKLLELGAGSGLFTQKILATQHFREIHVTDGAATMLEIAQKQLMSDAAQLQFYTLDFSETNWSNGVTGSFDAVTSSMAIHHAAQKQRLFEEVLSVLTPRGAFVFADHLAGTTEPIDQLIGHERGRIKLTTQGQDPQDDIAMREFLKADAEKQAAEGNLCESARAYLDYLSEAGFQHVDCLWRDFWLGVFVAQKG